MRPTNSQCRSFSPESITTMQLFADWLRCIWKKIQWIQDSSTEVLRTLSLPIRVRMYQVVSLWVFFFNVFTVAFPPTLFFTLFSSTNHHGCFISGHILLSFLKFFLLTFFAVVGPHSYEFPASPLTAYTDTYGAVKNILNNIFSKTPYEIDSTSARTCVCSMRWAASSQNQAQ